MMDVWLAALSVGAAVFVVVWTVGEWFIRPRLEWRPLPYPVADTFLQDRCRQYGCDEPHDVSERFVETRPEADSICDPVTP